ncbi:MAG: hemerythrin domain-containing protein [Solirubrobacterales bacterium]|nr:hemerythrin domain-containing protein [Solirubrobacterales bacterium]
MKRSESLKPLSHDHHHALYVAKRLREDEPGPAAEAFAEFWNDEGAAHFRIEEEVLLPGSSLDGPGSDDDVARMLDDHLEIRRRAKRVLEGEASEEELRRLGVRMSEHVRFEERRLFPRIESLLDGSDLERLGTRLDQAERSARAD